jgi:four helix bundle protein
LEIEHLKLDIEERDYSWQRSCNSVGMSVLADALKTRTKRFAVDVLRMIEDLPTNESGRVIRTQLAKSATSIAANYRAACQAQSRRHFVSKLQLVLEETDETQNWLELTIQAGWVPATRGGRLLAECGELTAIFTASVKTAKAHLKQ